MASGIADRPSVEELLADPGTLNVERLELQLRTHAAHVAAGTARFLALVAEYDRRKAYESWECLSCAKWLELHCQVAPATAHEYVRVARKLEELPAIWSAFSKGEISYSKVRAVTRVAGPASDTELLELARQMNAAQLGTVTRAMENVIREHSDERVRHVEERRGVERHPDGNGIVEWKLKVSEDEDLALRLAIEAARERHLAEARNRKKAADGGPDWSATWEKDRQAGRLSRLEALIAAVQAGVANDSGEVPDRYLTVLNVDSQDVGSDGTGSVLLGDGVRLHPAVARRLSCDTAIQLHVLDDDGGGVRMGRRIRTFTKKQRQLIAHRHKTCGFPGCDIRADRCQFHHYVHWTQGGNTDVDNGVPLCRRHHRAVHEGGWRLWRDRGGNIHAEGPDGRRLYKAPGLPAAPESAERGGLLELHGLLEIDPDPWQQHERAGWHQLRYIADVYLSCERLGFFDNDHPAAGPEPPNLN